MPEDHYQLVYTSVASFRFSQKDLTELLAQSRKDNLTRGITGLLLYADGHFMQLLEGAREKIHSLMINIKADVRHHDVKVLEECPVSDRQFSDWSMAFLDFASPEVRALPGYSGFLDSPLALEGQADTPTQNVRLLHYFKAVMTASDSAILSLAETIHKRKNGANGTHPVPSSG